MALIMATMEWLWPVMELGLTLGVFWAGCDARWSFLWGEIPETFGHVIRCRASFSLGLKFYSSPSGLQIEARSTSKSIVFWC